MGNMRRRISLSFAIVSIVIIIVVSLLMTFQYNNVTMDQMKENGSAMGNIIANGLKKYDAKDTSSIQSYIESSKQGKNIGYIMLVDDSGKVIASTDSDKVGKDSPISVKDALNKNSTTYKIEKYEGKEEYNTFVPADNGNVLALGMNLNGFRDNIIDMIKNIGIFIVLAIIASILVGVFISIKLSKPIKILTENMKKLSDGDFTVNIKQNSKEEVIAAAINNTMTILREMIKSIKDTSAELDIMSQNLSASSEEVSASGEEIANAVETMSNGASAQAEHLSKIVDTLTKFTDTLQEVDDKLGAVSDSSSKIKVTADNGAEEINRLVDSVEDVKNSFEYVNEKLDVLNGNVEKITEITDVINGVAEQTNLLALNAAIEAARAGEVGKGFSVVAEEIRVLAEQVLESSKSIADIVSTVASSTKDVSETANSVSNKMDVQVQTVEHTVAALKNILNESEAIVPKIKNVYQSLETVLGYKDNILDKVKTISEVADQASSRSQETLAAIEEQTASTEEFTASAQNLTTVSEKLMGKVSKFKVEV